MKLLKMPVILFMTFVSSSLFAQSLIEASVQALEVCTDEVPSELPTESSQWQICDETFSQCLIAASSIADYDVATCQELLNIDDPTAKKVYFFTLEN